MNKKILTLSTITTTLLASLSLAFFNNSIQDVEASKSTYYSGITATTGDDLLLQLHNNLIDKHSPYNSYNDVGSGEMQLEADKDFDRSGYIIDFYTQTSLKGEWDSGKTYNREHVWPKSLSNGTYVETGAGADVLMIRPSIPNINSSRGNDLYGEVGDSYLKSYNGLEYGYDSGTVFEPLDNVKGDAARIILYTYTHYASEIGGKSNSYVGNLQITDVIDENSDNAAFDLLLQWHELDPVSELEIYRNDYAEREINSRNPFVDFPEYVDAIWGSQLPPVTENSISINKSDTTIYSNETLQVNPTSTYGETYFTYESSNTDVATISSSGLINAISTGSSTITVRAENDGNNYSDSFILSVISAPVVGESNVYKKISSSSEIVSGGKYVIGNIIDSNIYIMPGGVSDGKPDHYSPSSDFSLINEDSFSTNVSIDDIGYTFTSDGEYFNIQSSNMKYFGPSSSTSMTWRSDPYQISVDVNSDKSCFITPYNSSESDERSICLFNLSDFRMYLNRITNNYRSSIFKLIESSSDPIEVSSVSITNKIESINISEESYQLECSVLPSNASDKSLTYNSSNSNVADISATGNIILKAAGSTTISITSNDGSNLSDSFVLTVVQTVVEPSFYYEGTPVTQYVDETFDDSGLAFYLDDGNSNISQIDNSLITFNPSVLTTSDTSVTASYLDYEVTINNITVEQRDDGAGDLEDVTYSHTFASGEITKVAGDIVLSELTWNQSALGYAGYSSKGAQLGSSGSPCSNFTLVTDFADLYPGYVVSKVIINASTASGGVSKLFLNNDSEYNYSLTTTATDYEFNLDSSLSTLTINMNATAKAMYIKSIDVILIDGSSSVSPLNELVNYILESDTENQCITKFPVAKEKYLNLASNDQLTFKTSDEDNISSARTRYEAWARNQGQNPYEEGALNSPILDSKDNMMTIILLVIGGITLLNLAGYVYLKKSKK